MLRLFALIFILCVFRVNAQMSNDEWKFLGPRTNYYQYKGLLTSVWADPKDLDHVYADVQMAVCFILQREKALIPSGSILLTTFLT